MEASLYRHDWLNRWPLVIDSTSTRPYPPLPQKSRDGNQKFQPSDHRVGPPGNQLPKVASSQNKRLLYHSLHLGNSKHLWARNCGRRPNVYEKCMLVIWMTKYMLLLNHTVTYFCETPFSLPLFAAWVRHTSDLLTLKTQHYTVVIALPSAAVSFAQCSFASTYLFHCHWHIHSRYITFPYVMGPTLHYRYIILYICLLIKLRE